MTSGKIAWENLPTLVRQMFGEYLMRAQEKFPQAVFQRTEEPRREGKHIIIPYTDRRSGAIYEAVATEDGAVIETRERDAVKREQLAYIAPGCLLLAPRDAGSRAADVLCVFDEDQDEPGAFFALVLNQPTDAPAQPLAFGLFDCGKEHAWWGGPTHESFALVQLFRRATVDDEYLPTGEPRRYITPRTAVWLPGRDHAPSAPARVRVFSGCVWLSPEQTQLYQREGLLLPAADEVLFDRYPTTLPDRLRASH